MSFKGYSFVEISILTKIVPKNTQIIEMWDSAVNAEVLVHFHYYIYKRYYKLRIQMFFPLL